jgi:hypothetical protein
MSDFDDAIGDMTQELLTEAGSSCVYHRGATSTTIVMRKSAQQPMLIDNGDGIIVELRPVDFICLTLTFPYAEPVRGDQITLSGSTYEVQAMNSEKCYRIISDQMLRIHSKKVN